MLPAPFEYHAAKSMDEALGLLDTLGEDAKILAGGQSLIPLLKLRFASPAHLVDINGIKELDFIEEGDGTLRIGPLFRHKAAERSSLLASRYHVMADAAPQIADPIIRNRGTIAGSVAHADPSGDWGTVLLALDAELVLRSKSGSRTVKARDFFSGPFSTVLEPTEVLSEIRIPAARPQTGGAYLKLERKVGDFATVAVAVHLQMDGGKVGSAGIGLTAVGPQNIKAEQAEAALRGARLDDATIKEAAALAADAAEPKADHRGSVEYKRNVVRVFTERGLKRAYERARGGG
ncbi:MAG: xanthine dehydrogenase family protein subunit M [Chloroflexi bacterium]|nr:MAG: xanthine dehydrogenase family protein subunit M [Chloroflexota bacterium]TMF91440.1 MAG: xanthine dehydrogenase family protein subunit M [Chloroflexota bacterium]